MTPELMALYHLHRFQITLNARNHEGELRLPQAFLYAIANGVYPYFHQTWSCENDPYVDCYRIKKEFISEVLEYVDNLWRKGQPVPTFYQLESKFGKGFRVELIDIFRYCFLGEQFDDNFYEQLLRATDHPTEASNIIAEFEDSDFMLV